MKGMGPDLPFPRPPSASVAGRTLADSTHQWRKEPKRLAPDAPNIVIFMTDDAGFANPSCFGGPINLPTMARLANNGVAYNRFHTTAMCSPTRASLLTGRNHHAVGFGQIAEFSSDFDGYVGEIPRSAATIAQVLSGYGYETGAFGKWHNTPVTHVTKTGPFHLWPTGLGFDYFYGFVAGHTGQYEPTLFENTVAIEPPRTAAEGYHLTEDLADKAISFVRNNRTLSPDRPMFLYVTPGAVHGPHQVHREWSMKYLGQFDEGWETLREKTFHKQKELGWIPETAELTPIDPTMQKWADVPDSQRPFQTRLMEVYAGFLEHVDAQYGRVVDELEAQGLLDNTLIFYINSDNGASAEGLYGALNELILQNAMEIPVEEQIEVLDRDYGGLDALGTRLVENNYHHGWAWAGETPFRSTKLVAAHFGGTRTPLVVSWPKAVQPDKAPREQFHHVVDVATTIYDILGIDPPGRYNGVEQDRLDGVSMAPSFNDTEAPTGKRTQYFEIYGSRGVYQDGWFAGAFGPRTPWISRTRGLRAWNPDQDVWELYNLEDDYSQAIDLAAEFPEKLAELKDVFTVQATRNQVLPVGAAFYTVALHRDELPGSDLTKWTFYPGQNRISEPLAPRFTSGHSSVSRIELDAPERASGVLFCVGGIAGGFTVYMDDGYLHAEYNTVGMYRYKVRSKERVKAGAHLVGVQLEYESKKLWAPAVLTLSVDGQEVGHVTVETSVGLYFSFFETFDVGTDLGSPVSLDYHERSPFPFEGSIERIDISYLDRD